MTYRPTVSFPPMSRKRKKWIQTQERRDQRYASKDRVIPADEVSHVGLPVRKSAPATIVSNR